MSPDRVETEVDGRPLTLSNLAKVLYPETGFTKGEMLDYYARIADVMLPHLQDRPLTMKRFPDGVDGPSFFEKHVPNHAPEWVRTVEVPRSSSTKRQDTEVEYAVVCDRPTLIWAANLAAIEFHVPLWRVGDGVNLPKRPDFMVFDLDPGPGTSILECCRIARWIDELFDDELFAKTSGSKGLQLYRRLDGSSAEDATAEAHDVAARLVREHPDAVVASMRKELRNGKVLIDWSQNSSAKTTVGAYSLRARPAPTVSTPVTWAEIDEAIRHHAPEALVFLPGDVLRRIERHGDLFAPMVEFASSRRRVARRGG